jgi:hypothetical protein
LSRRFFSITLQDNLVDSVPIRVATLLPSDRSVASPSKLVEVDAENFSAVRSAVAAKHYVEEGIWEQVHRLFAGEVDRTSIRHAVASGEESALLAALIDRSQIGGQLDLGSCFTWHPWTLILWCGPTSRFVSEVLRAVASNAHAIAIVPREANSSARSSWTRDAVDRLRIFLDEALQIEDGQKSLPEQTGSLHARLLVLRAIHCLNLLIRSVGPEERVNLESFVCQWLEENRPSTATWRFNFRSTSPSAGRISVFDRTSASSPLASTTISQFELESVPAALLFAPAAQQGAAADAQQLVPIEVW